MFIEKTDGPAPIPMGEYPATIKAHELVDGQYGKQLKFTFDLGVVTDTNGDDRECTLSTWRNLTLNPKSKLWELAIAAGIELDEDSEGMDVDDLIGRRVLLGVDLYVKKEDGTERNKVISVKPPRKKAAKPAKPTPKDDEDEDDDRPF